MIFKNVKILNFRNPTAKMEEQNRGMHFTRYAIKDVKNIWIDAFHIKSKVKESKILEKIMNETSTS